MRFRTLLYSGLIVLGLILWGGSTAYAQEEHGALLTVDGIIDSVKANFVERGIGKAQDEGARLIIIRLDTPGGLLSATEDIVKEIFDAQVPTVVYVSPQGAFAASAGTFITASANFAVMAPASTIGAASPVGGGGEDLPETLKSKATNFTAEWIRSIAEERGRNADALEDTVRKAVAFSAEEAVEVGVVDFIAEDMEDLLNKLDGRTVVIGAQTVALQTQGLALREIKMNLAERFLGFIADPNIALLLLTIGGLGIMLELFSPGVIVPGVVGLISLGLAFTALGILSFQWAGLAFLGLFLILLFFELQAPGWGILGLGAVASFIIGAILLFSPGAPGFPDAPIMDISLWVLVAISSAVGLFALVVGYAVIRSRRIKILSSVTRLIGQKGVAKSDLAPSGTIQVSSELWSAIVDTGETIHNGEEVKVVAAEGLVLKVRKA